MSPTVHNRRGVWWCAGGLSGALAILLLAAGPAAGQGARLPGKKGAPVTIEANDGIEWRQDKKVYIARGNATVIRGSLTLRAGVLTAHYRGKSGKGTSLGGAMTKAGSNIWRVTAAGSVRITDGDKVITGDLGVYNLDTGVFVLTGRKVSMKTANQLITATGRIEYRSKDKSAIVEGDAVAIQDDKKVTADRFVASFQDGPDGKLQVKRVVAEGNVVISTKSELITADRGIYNHQTGIAEMIGNVKLTRGDSQLNGARAVVNLKTGVSRLLARRGGGRVRGLFIPGGATGGAAPKGLNLTPGGRQGGKATKSGK
ncbi:MAG: LptA/OstA family protein [Alphaproteobacteria bacterium]